MGSTIAAGTAYATHATHMIPVYIFYSMFGFQRTGDQMWAFGDQMGRGFLLGATAGPDHADRRGPAAQRRPLGAARVGQPGVRRLRRGLGVRAVLHRQGRAAPDVRLVPRAPGRREHLLLPDRLQRALRAARRAGRLPGRHRGAGAGHPARPVPVRRRAAPAEDARSRRAAARADPRLGRGAALGAGRAAAAGRGLGRRRRGVVGHVLDRAAPGRAGLRRVEPAAPGRRAARAATSPARWPITPARSWR